MNKKSVAIATIAAGLATLAVAAPAKGRHHRGGAQNFDALKTYLALSDDQVTAIKDARKAQFESMKASFPEIQAKRKAMHEALQSGTADPATLGNMQLEQQATRKKLQADRAAFSDRLLNTLNPDQKAKLDELKGKHDAAARQAMRLGLLKFDRAAEGSNGASRGFGRRNTQRF